MTRTLFAMTVAGLLLAAVPGTSQAAPIAPLGSAVTTTDQGNLTQVRWWGWHHGWHYGWHPYWHRWHRRCWVGRWGRVHCW